MDKKVSFFVVLFVGPQNSWDFFSYDWPCVGSGHYPHSWTQRKDWQCNEQSSLYLRPSFLKRFIPACMILSDVGLIFCIQYITFFRLWFSVIYWWMRNFVPIQTNYTCTVHVRSICCIQLLYITAVKDVYITLLILILTNCKNGSQFYRFFVNIYFDINWFWLRMW